MDSTDPVTETTPVAQREGGALEESQVLIIESNESNVEPTGTSLRSILSDIHVAASSLEQLKEQKNKTKSAINMSLLSAELKNASDDFHSRQEKSKVVKPVDITDMLKELVKSAHDFEARHAEDETSTKLDINSLLAAIREFDISSLHELELTEKEKQVLAQVEAENPLNADGSVNARYMTSYDLTELKQIAVRHAIRHQFYIKNRHFIDEKLAKELRNVAFSFGIKYVHAHRHARLHGDGKVLEHLEKKTPLVMADEEPEAAVSKNSTDEEDFVIVTEADAVEEKKEVVSNAESTSSTKENDAATPKDDATTAQTDGQVEIRDTTEYDKIIKENLPTYAVIPPVAQEDHPIHKDSEELAALLAGLLDKSGQLGAVSTDKEMYEALDKSNVQCLESIENLVDALGNVIKTVPYSADLGVAFAAAKAITNSTKTQYDISTVLSTRLQTSLSNIDTLVTASTKEVFDYVHQNASLKSHVDNLSSQIVANTNTITLAQELVLSLLADNQRLKDDLNQRDALLKEQKIEVGLLRDKLEGTLVEKADDRLANAVMVVRERLRLEAVDAEITEAIRVVRLQILKRKSELDDLRGRGGKKTRQTYYDSVSSLVRAMEKLLVRKAGIVKAIDNVRSLEDGVEADIAVLFSSTPELCPPKYAPYLVQPYDKGIQHEVVEREAEVVQERYEEAEYDETEVAIRRAAALSTKDWLEGGKGTVTGVGKASGSGGPQSRQVSSAIDDATSNINEDSEANQIILGNDDELVGETDIKQADRTWLPLKSQIVDVVASNAMLSSQLIMSEEEKDTVRKLYNKNITKLNTSRAQNRLLRVYAGPDAVKFCEDEVETDMANIAPNYKIINGLYLGDIDYDVDNVWAKVEWDATRNDSYESTSVTGATSTKLLSSNINDIVSSFYNTQDDEEYTFRVRSRSRSRSRTMAGAAQEEANAAYVANVTTTDIVTTTLCAAPVLATPSRGRSISTVRTHAVYNSVSGTPAANPPPSTPRKSDQPMIHPHVRPISPSSRLLMPKNQVPRETTRVARDKTPIRNTYTTVVTTPRNGNNATGSFKSPTSSVSRGRARNTEPMTPRPAPITQDYVSYPSTPKGK